MPDLLFLCHRLPYPPDRGCRIRAFHLLQSLAASHRVHLISFADDRQQPSSWQPLHELCASVTIERLPAASAYLRTAASAWRSRPLTLSYFDSLHLRRTLRPWLRHPPDVTVAFSTAMAPAALAVGAPALLDMVDVDSQKWAQYARRGCLPMRPVYALEARRMRACEADLAPRFERVTLATDRETELLRAIAPRAAACTLRNGTMRGDTARATELDPDPTLLFTGQMDYLPNVDAMVTFAHTVLPPLRARHPRLRLLVVGRSPSAAVRRLAALPGVTVSGTVPDLTPYLQRAWVFVAPLRIAQGVQSKVLEAMAAALPVVTTSQVLAGLRDGGVEAGADLLVADDTAASIAAIDRLLTSPAERRRLGDRAHARMAASYDWQAVYRQLGAIVDEVRLAPRRQPDAAATAHRGALGAAASA